MSGALGASGSGASRSPRHRGNGYTASIRHSESTVRMMAKVQYETFRPMGGAVVFLLALALLSAGVLWTGLRQNGRILCLALGCFALAGTGAPHRELARQVIRSLNGHFPSISYRFGEDSVQLTGTDTASALRYEELCCLVAQGRYLYLFLQDHSAYMLDRASIQPDEAGLMEFLSEKTALRWRQKRLDLFRAVRERAARCSRR